MQDQVDTPPRPKLTTVARAGLVAKIIIAVVLIRTVVLPDIFGSWAWIPGLLVVPLAVLAWIRAERSGGRS